MSTQKKVVIIGGGGGGSLAALKLQGLCDLTLIDKKSYCDFNIAAPRALVDASVTDKIIIPHEEYLKKATIILGLVREVREGFVVVEGRSEPIPYDYLIVASGSSYPVFKGSAPSPSDRRSEFALYREKIAAAKTILVIGGGPTGVEMASELVETYPEKEITLAHNGPNLLDLLSPKAQRLCKLWFEKKKNVKLVLDQTVNDLPKKISVIDKPSSFTTSRNETLKADLTFICIGAGAPNTDFLRAHFANLLDAQGRVLVDESLRAKGSDKIFALGDAAATSDPKLYYAATVHAELIAKNITTLLKNPNAILKKHKPLPPMALVTLGRNNGVMMTPMGTVGGWVPKKVKSQTVFIPQARKRLGLRA